VTKEEVVELLEQALLTTEQHLFIEIRTCPAKRPQLLAMLDALELVGDTLRGRIDALTR